MAAPPSHGERAQRVRSLLREEGLAGLVAFSPADCRYLSGFTGEAASVVLTASNLTLITDARFRTQAEEEVPDLSVSISEESLDQPLGTVLVEQLAEDDPLREGEAPPVIGIESTRLTVKRWERLRTLLEERDVEWRLVDGLVEKARLLKFPDEIAAMRAAGSLAAAAFAHLESLSVVGRSERDVALDLEVFLRRNGSDGVAFPFIVAAGPRGAMPHGEASKAIIARDQLVVFDLGAVVEGYASDITRTYATGSLSDELVSAYEAVRNAQEAAVQAVKAGLSCKDLDQEARQQLAKNGLAERFVHSLGHGVGLEVHEAPTVSSRSEDVLQPGMAVTIEPGVYLPGVGGVRIEDTVIVAQEGAEVLTQWPRELRVLA